jgi:hypothetical protein
MYSGVNHVFKVRRTANHTSSRGPMAESRVLFMYILWYALRYVSRNVTGIEVRIKLRLC